MSDDAERILQAVGTLEARHVRRAVYTDIAEAEFQVFSQFGEDGIIQYLLGKVAIDDDVFVEIGVGDYREANTRFLLVHDNWRGLIIDAGDAHAAFLQTHPLGWRHDIRAVSSFVTTDNVNQTIEQCGIAGDIGLLSVDIDGNDYWVLDALHVVSPRILIVEYNSLFGGDRAVTVPYIEGFTRFDAHHSGLYWGASLGALAALASSMGYRLVGSNRAGNNAFFVRNDIAGDLPSKTSLEAWRPARIREARDPEGRLTYESDRRKLLRAMRALPLVAVDDGRTASIDEIYGLAARPD